MEEKKKFMWRKIAWRSVNVLIALMVLVGVFALSVPAGISAIVFGALGFGFGFWAKYHRNTEKFLATLLENKESFFEGKTVTVTADEEAGAISFHVTTTADAEVVEEVTTVEKEQPKKKKKKHQEK